MAFAVKLEYRGDFCVRGRNDGIDPVVMPQERKDLLNGGGCVFITCLVVSCRQVPSLAAQEVDHLTGTGSSNIVDVQVIGLP